MAMQFSSSLDRFAGLLFCASLGLNPLLVGAAPPEQSPYAVSSPRRPEVASQGAKVTLPAPKPIELPPLPEGVEELKFTEFFKLPVGPRGLEITPRLQALDGKRVRIFGHMVKEDLTPCNSCPVAPVKGKRPRPAWMEFVVPGRMMFTELPAMVSHAHYGLADDLPPQTLFVTVPDRFGELVPYTPGAMLLTGVLSVGNKPEPDGRISVVRLTLDPPARNAAAPPPSLSENQPTANQTQ
jgi:hypothetical protein